MKFLFTTLAFLLMGCSSLPKSSTPIWSLSNRYAVDMEVGCNTTKRSVGIIGCSLKGQEKMGQLKVSTPMKGTLFFDSYKCSRFTLRNNVPATSISLDEIFDGDEICSFRVTETIDGFDNVLIGRVILFDLNGNPYYEKLNFSLGDKKFNGVGWIQAPKTKAMPKLVITPRGQRGHFRMMCGESLIKTDNYTMTPFTVQLDESLPSCDYLMTVVNSDAPSIEFGLLAYEVQDTTLDLAHPLVYEKSGKTVFEFTDKNTEGKYIVVTVQVNDQICYNSNHCSDKLTESYSVKALTLDGQYFSGIYKAKKWEID